MSSPISRPSNPSIVASMHSRPASTLSAEHWLGGTSEMDALEERVLDIRLRQGAREECVESGGAEASRQIAAGALARRVVRMGAGARRAVLCRGIGDETACQLLSAQRVCPHQVMRGMRITTPTLRTRRSRRQRPIAVGVAGADARRAVAEGSVAYYWLLERTDLYAIAQ